MPDIARYEINEHGELPLSYGRYVRYEDFEKAMNEMSIEIYRLQEMNEGRSYSEGYEDGYDKGWNAAMEKVRWE